LNGPTLSEVPRTSRRLHEEKWCRREKKRSGRPSPACERETEGGRAREEEGKGRKGRESQSEEEEEDVVRSGPLETRNRWTKRSARRTEEDDVGLDEGVLAALAPLLGAAHDLAAHDGRLDLLLGVGLLAVRACRARERAVRLDDEVVLDLQRRGKASVWAGRGRP